MANLRSVILALVLLALPGIPSASSLRSPDDWREAAPGWAAGPVWYIMTTAEYRSYRALRSEPDRRAFIRGFWSRRDPIPESPENELETAFWERVRIADARFGYEVKPGWKTARGKIFILLGAPDNLEEDSILQDRYAVSRWVYDLTDASGALRQAINDTLGIRGNQPIVRLHLREEADGARQVSDHSGVTSSVLRPTDLLPLAEALVRRSGGRVEALRQLGHAMRVPEVLDRLHSRVQVSSVFSQVPVEGRVDYRPAPAEAGPGSTIVAVTVSVRWSDLERAGLTAFDPSAALLTGRLTRIDGERASFPLAGSFGADPDPDPGSLAAPFAFQAVTAVPPGRYRLDVSWQETGDRLMGSLSEAIEVPAFPASGFAAGSLVLAERLDKLIAAASDERLAPFRLGSYRIVPRTSARFAPSEPLTLFFAVSGASAPEGLPHLDAALQFYIEDGATWLPVGTALASPDLHDTAMAWQIPLTDWGAGRYRVEVLVTDRNTGESLVRGALFEIALPQTAAAAPRLSD